MKTIQIMTESEVLEYLGLDKQELNDFVAGNIKELRPLPCHKLDNKRVFFYREVSKWEEEFDNYYITGKAPF